MLPEVPYAPLVFTIPKMLRPAFLFDGKLYTVLCRAAYRVVRVALAAHFSQLDAPVPAFLASSQSFGNLLNHHPHVHALASHGVFERDGAFHPADDFDFAALELPFRDAVLSALLERGVIDEERVDLIRSWPHSGFGIHSECVIEAGDRRALESILEYMERSSTTSTGRSTRSGVDPSRKRPSRCAWFLT